MTMQRWWAVCLIILLPTLCLSPVVLVAQDELTSDQLRRMYDDALAQLKTAQDRRNELARENEKLRARVTQLEKDIETAQSATAAIADRTFQARSQAALLDAFLKANPYFRGQWQAFVEQNLLTPPDSKRLLDPDWPLPPNR